MKVDHVGRVLGNWEIVSKLGQGAFGAVYEVRHRSIAGRRAAVKVLHAHHAATEEMRRRFLNEASAASRAEHENIVQIFDCGDTEDGLCYVVMELLRGTRLSDALRSGSLGVARSIRIAAQIAGALGAAHRVGIIHRDLKPDNILLIARDTDAEFVKVLDFGIAKLWDHESQTKTGVWMGTPPYMSPEQWQTLPDIDGRSDIYALGVILHECLTGMLPFQADTPFGWLNAHLSQPVPDPRQHGPLPEGLVELVMRMLAKDRRQRPKDMHEVLAALQQAGPLPGEPAVDLRRPTGSLSPAARPSTSMASSGEVHQRPARTTRVALWGAGAVLGIVLALGGHYLLRRGETGPEQRTLVPPIAPKGDGDRGMPAGTASLPTELVVLGPGRILMGWGDGRDADGPAHEVAVGPFAIGRYEISQGEFRQYAEDIGWHGALPWDGIPDFSRVRDLPVNQVRQKDAADYCRWRYPKLGGRLPSEAEWEYAAREGRDNRRFPWPGQAPDSGLANVGSHRPMLQPVTGMQQGDPGIGLHHIIGNVAEWTAGEAMPYPGGQAVAPGQVVVRGGGAATPLREARATVRQFVSPGTLNPFIGFRCAANAP